MPAPYLLTCPLRSPVDLPASVSRFGLSARRGRQGAGRRPSRPTHRSYPSIALKHRLQATAISPICFA